MYNNANKKYGNLNNKKINFVYLLEELDISYF